MARKGENIYKRKDGRWEGRYIKEYRNGKAKYGYVYAPDYAEVKARLKELSAERDKEKEITFQHVSIDWLESIRPRLKEQSVIMYENLLINHLYPEFEARPVESITRKDVVSFINVLLTMGGSNGNGLSPSTVEGVLSVFRRILEYASEYKQCNVIHIEKSLVKQSQKPMRIFSLLEQQKLSNFLTDNLTLTNLGILLCLYTGIRIGEVCALKWEDFSFDEQYLYIHKTMQRIKIKGDPNHKTTVIISDPKSVCSIRRIPIPDNIFKLIISFKRPGNTYFLTGFPNIYIEPRTLQNRFKSVIKSCNLEDANFHALRHTFATRCVELGFDVKSLSEILGHASINITLNRYVHPSMETKQKNMNILSDLITVR